MNLFARFFFVLALAATLPAWAQFDDPRADLQWSQIETEHFRVVYHAGTERTARLTAKIAEEVYGPITALYDHRPDQRVTFVIKDIADYANGETNYYTNTIVLWANALDFDMRGTHNWLRNVIAHEFTHDVQIQTAMKLPRRIPTIAFQYLGYENERRQDVLSGYPNKIVTVPFSGSVVPAWFAEGVAQYMRPELGYESWDAHRDMILRMAILDTTLLTWNEMSTFGKTSYGDESSYNTGFALIRYVGEVYGEQAVREISYNLASFGRMTIDGAIEKTLGKSGAALYDEWRGHLRQQYAGRIAPVLKHTVIGDTIAKVGFGNFHAQFTPDGKNILYVSNKTSDYFSGAAFLCDPVTRTDTAIVSVSGRAMFAPDGNRLIYARRSRLDIHHSSFMRLHVYDRAKKEDKVISDAWRAHSPAISPDGTHIVFVTDSDGTQNLCVVDDPFGEHPTMRALTTFNAGEQIYNPVYTPDGRTLVFDFSARDRRVIAAMDTAGKGFHIVMSGSRDYRSPAFSRAGTMCFACDSNGIFNIYAARWDAGSASIVGGSVRQVTNVPGGAFYPAIDSAGNIAYSLHTGRGYKLAYLRKSMIDSLTTGVDFGPLAYRPPEPVNTAPLRPDGTRDGITPRPALNAGNFDWPALRAYDDTKVPEYTSVPYRNAFTSLFIIPILRVDTYSKFNSGLEHVKLGALFTSSDVTDRLGILAGGMTNSKFEYDLFAALTFHDRVPLLWKMGINPTITLGIFNSQRLSRGSFPVPVNAGTRVDTVTTNVGATYNFLSFDVSAASPIFNAAHTVQFGFNHTRYTASTDGFINPQNGRSVSLPSDLYLYTTTASAGYAYSGIAPTRTEEINPVGRDVHATIGQEWNRVEDTVIVGDGGLPQRLYLPYDYVRAGIQWHEHLGLPWWTHTLSFTLRGDAMVGGAPSIFNERAHAMFDTYIGGLYGMEGYPFYAIGGTRTLSLKATYRFPVTTNLDLRLGALYLDKIFLGAFADYGAAWNGALDHAFDDARKDVGVEFRMDAFLWYNVPMKFFFNAAYGLDRFDRAFRYANDQALQNVTYGHEWLFYTGVGFDFPE